MDWEYYLLFVLVLAQMLRTNLTLAHIHSNLETMNDRQAIVIMPVQAADVDPEEIGDAPAGGLVDLVNQWDYGE
jgi:hypothetical protein